MSKYVITGGSGFIMSNLIEYLLYKYRDIQIVNVDKLTYAGNISSNDAIASDARYHFRQYDICDKEAMEYIFRMWEPDYLINGAAESHVDNSLKNGKAFVDTNVWGTLNLLEITKNYGKLQKFIQISTDEVFGQTLIGSTDETAKYDPRNPYAASKTAAEHMVNSYVESYNIPITITRTTNNYGKYQHPEKFIPGSIKKIINGDKIKIYGDGSQIREWIHVMDHCYGIDTIMRTANPPNLSINITGGYEISNYELARMICTRLKVDPDEYIEFKDDRPGHDQRYSLSSKYFRQRTTIPFNFGLTEVVEWYKNKFTTGVKVNH